MSDSYISNQTEAAKWRGVKWTGAKSRFRAYVVTQTLPLRETTIGHYRTAIEAAQARDRALVDHKLYLQPNFPAEMPEGWTEEYQRREILARQRLPKADPKPIEPTPKPIEVPTPESEPEPLAETMIKPTPEPTPEPETKVTSEMIESRPIEPEDIARAFRTVSGATGENIVDKADILDDIKQRAAIIVVVIESTKRYKAPAIVAALEEILGKYKSGSNAK